jgi:hypothetical protein
VQLYSTVSQHNELEVNSTSSLNTKTTVLFRLGVNYFQM